MCYYPSVKIITDKEKIDEVLTRGVEDVFVKEDLIKQMSSGEQLRVKLGIDPTSPFIHLGRAITLRKLKAFQDLGHQVVLIIGDFTAKIGDPSDKLEKRPMLNDEQIKSNLEKYLEQISLILDMKNVEVRYNSEWLEPMSIPEMGRLLECFTVQQMTKRRNFKDRLDKGQDIFVTELLYPAFQGYDSVAIKSNIEIGGFDQLFNLKAGRTVQKRYGQKEQDIMVLSMLEGTDGRKMSSSWGNIISIIDKPNDMFQKIMEVKDDLIIKYFTLCTDLSLDQIKSYKKNLDSLANPRDIKIKLASEIVKIYHGEESAQKAEESFINTFQKKEIPEEMDVLLAKMGELLSEVLVKHKVLPSKSEWRRLVKSGAVSDLVKKEKITEAELKVTGSLTLKVGKKKFIKILPK
jgi:tyrosyl-tRNA synthetase